jgi:DNA-binding transcriptional LysR family regulator
VLSAYERLPLGALRVFEAVATHLNFSEAAEALNVTPAAVSQQIKTLESYIQVPLFRRKYPDVELRFHASRELVDFSRAAEEGLGFALSRWTVVTRSLQKGTLRLASKETLPFGSAFYFVCPRPFLALPKVAQFREWIFAAARDFPGPGSSPPDKT